MPPQLANQLPPEFLQALLAQGSPQLPPSAGAPQLPPPPGMPPGMPPMPPGGRTDAPIPDALMGASPFPGSSTGFPPNTPGLPPGMPGPSLGIGAALAPGQMSPMGGPPDLNDPILAQMLMQPPAQPAQPQVPDTQKPGYRELPTQSEIEMWVRGSEREHHQLLLRMARDLALYRQHEGGVPSDFDADYEIQVVSAAISNLVNKLSNLMAGADAYVEVPFVDWSTQDQAQAVENYCYYCRDYKRFMYARGGGNDLQRDEFFYLFLYGRVVARVLPNTYDTRYPFSFALLDPATCYPIWGDGNNGMTAMVREYRTSVQKVLAEYGMGNPDLERSLMKKLGYDKPSSDFLNHLGTVTEWWDTWNRALYFQGVELFHAPHKLGVVPFVYVTAVGEPKALMTPRGRYVNAWRDQMLVHPVGGDVDLAEKGVSVFHHLINTHRLKEAIQTILYGEVEKVRQPPTITYSAPHLMGQDPPPLDLRRGGNNQRIKDLQEVQGMPTSPHPTDLSPLMQQLSDDWFGGAMNPAGMGMEMGANASGYSLETLIANAKDLTVPYSKAYENYLGLLFDLELKMYRDVIAPLVPLSVPGSTNYGSADQKYPLTPAAIEAVGTQLKVSLRAMGPRDEAQLIQIATQAQGAGIWSQQYAMHRAGIKDPKRMFDEILIEKGMQHPKVMEMQVIPEAMVEGGAADLAKSFLQLVVLPDLMQQQQMMGPGGAPPPGAPPGGAPPGQNMGGIRQLGQPPGPPTGPQPGQGRRS